MLALWTEGGVRMLQTYRCIDQKNAFYQYILGNRSNSEPQFSGANYRVPHNPSSTVSSDFSCNNQMR
jgi:hypothetical protein